MKRYFTVVFEWNNAFKDCNPMVVETPWGKAICLATGDLTAQTDIYEEALEGIADSNCMGCAMVAQKALDDANNYVLGQIGRERVEKARVRFGARGESEPSS